MGWGCAGVGPFGVTGEEGAVVGVLGELVTGTTLVVVVVVVVVVVFTPGNIT